MTRAPTFGIAATYLNCVTVSTSAGLWWVVNESEDNTFRFPEFRSVQTSETGLCFALARR